jgi:hypothetical protein
MQLLLACLVAWAAWAAWISKKSIRVLRSTGDFACATATMRLVKEKPSVLAGGFFMPVLKLRTASHSK